MIKLDRLLVSILKKQYS